MSRGGIAKELYSFTALSAVLAAKRTSTSAGVYVFPPLVTPRQDTGLGGVAAKVVRSCGLLPAYGFYRFNNVSSRVLAEFVFHGRSVCVGVLRVRFRRIVRQHEDFVRYFPPCINVLRGGSLQWSRVAFVLGGRLRSGWIPVGFCKFFCVVRRGRCVLWRANRLTVHVQLCSLPERVVGFVLASLYHPSERLLPLFFPIRIVVFCFGFLVSNHLAGAVRERATFFHLVRIVL